MLRRVFVRALAISFGALAIALTFASARARAETTAPAQQELNLLIANLLLEDSQLSDTVYLYELDNDVLLPVGELAQQLTLGVTVDPVSHVASGFLLTEDAAFRLDPAASSVTLPTGKEDFDPGLVRWIDGDLYVASRLLQRWWPVDFKFNMSALSLQALPREKLPIQLKIEREKAASRLGKRGGYVDPGYPRIKNSYRFLALPIIDSTITLNLNKRDRAIASAGAYSGVFAGDLLGMEAMGHVSLSKDDPTPDARITLARNDPDGGLLGPLDATTLELGNIGLPAVRNVMSGGGVGWGSIISNRPLNQVSSYGLQTLRGELPTGWDVTLYFNDALIAFAPSRGDGLYEFPDQPLIFGRNEFRLVFNGPLGQRRVDRQVFILDQTVIRPGDFYYTAGAKRDDDGAFRSTLQIDAGIIKGWAITAGSIHINRGDGAAPRTYLNGGIRASLLGSLVNLDHSHDLRGGSVTELGLRTSLFNISVDASRIWVNDFVSDVYGGNGDGIKVRDQVRMNGLLAISSSLRLPYALDVSHEKTAAGVRTFTVQPRASVNILGTSFTNSLNWRLSPGPDELSGSLQVSRSVAGIRASSQFSYAIKPHAKLESFGVNLEKALDQNNRINFGLVRSFGPSGTTVTAGLTRNFGAFGVSFSALYGGSKNIGVGLQIFTAFGRNPRRARPLRDWRPMAGMGVVAAKVFVDANMNGVWDQGEQTIQNAGFTVNGSDRQGVYSDGQGEAVLFGLTPNVHTDVALDLATLEDAQWQPVQPGVRIVPRPGKVQSIDFPVALTAEIDGTVYLLDGKNKRGIGNARLQLVDTAGKVVGETKTSSDGYYIVSGIRPGRYQLRIDAEQLSSLGLQANRVADITITPQGDFVYGVDFILSRPAP